MSHSTAKKRASPIEPYWLINYLFLTVLGVLSLMKWGIEWGLYFAHAYAAATLIYATARSTGVISQSRKTKELLFLFFLFLYWCFLLYLFYADILGDVIGAVKPLVSFVLLNFLLGLLIGITLKSRPSKDMGSVILFYNTWLVITVAFLAYIALSSDYYDNWLILHFEGFEDFYQTVAGYLARVLLVGMFVMFFLDKNARFRPKLIPLVVCIPLFAIFLLLVGSKKEVGLFLVFGALVLYWLFSRNLAALAIVGVITCIAGYAYLDESVFEQIRYVQDVERSVSSRRSFLEDYEAQLDRSGFFGNPFAYLLAGGYYPHSFSLSLIMATGLPGVLVFAIFFLYFILSLIERRSFRYLIVLAVVFALSNVATFFDYFVFWFLIGLGTSLLVEQVLPQKSRGNASYGGASRERAMVE